MTTKSTKRALLVSVLSLFICFTMLLGTSYAWFSDTVTSTGNIIKTGTLEVSLDWAEGSKEVPTTDDGWTDASAGAIFTYPNWEPGYVAARHMKITNDGSLSLKYTLSIVPNGEVGILADVIDVYVTEGGAQITDRAQLGTHVGTLADIISDGIASGELASKEERTFTIVLKMQESAGNDYQGLELKGGFSVQLLATQATQETDDLGEGYDEGLEVGRNGVSLVLDDGSTVFYYNEESGFAGRVRLTALPENLGSEYVVPSEVNDLGGALVGITLDKLTIPAEIEYAYKSLQGASIDEVVIADGATTVPNRMFYKANVANVVIPDSVTTIEENAFAQAGPTTLTIPASVATVGEAAFQHMPNLTTVTFEGDTAIEGYAFRACANLRTVYLNGEDVSFVVSATGKNSCWFSNTESNNPSENDITFYVQNETVAERVKTAMGVGSEFRIILPGMYTVGGVGVFLTNEAYDSIEYHNSNADGKVRYIEVYTAQDLESAIELYQKGVIVHNGTNDIEPEIHIMSDIDFGGQDFAGFGKEFYIYGNGHTLSNVNFVANAGGKAGLISYAGNNIISELTVKDATVTGAQAGIFCGNATNVQIVDCALEGNITVNWEANASEEYNGVAAVWGVVAEDNRNTIDIDISNANITVNKDGITYAAGKSDEGNGIVGVVYGGSYTLTVDGNEAVEGYNGLYVDAEGKNLYVYDEVGLQSMKNWMDANFNNKFWGKTYNIMADIDATDVVWNTKHISPDSATFDGIIFDGHGHTISNLTINGNGLITGATKGGASENCSVFKDITFYNVTVTGGSHHNGVVWGEAYGSLTLENVNVIESKVSGGCNVGGLVGRNSESHAVFTFKDCAVKNTTVAATQVADYSGASAFLGMALHIGTSCSATVIFEGTNVSEGNTITTASGMQGGGIYTTATWGDATWETPVVVDTFTNYNN